MMTGSISRLSLSLISQTMERFDALREKKKMIEKDKKTGGEWENLTGRKRVWQNSMEKDGEKNKKVSMECVPNCALQRKQTKNIYKRGNYCMRETNRGRWTVGRHSRNGSKKVNLKHAQCFKMLRKDSDSFIQSTKPHK